MPNRVFVFGSNLRGVHGAGAAKFALEHHGASWGVGEGPTGEAYALPTKDRNIETRPLDEIREAVDQFIDYAKHQPQIEFQVTRIGCGLAGLLDSDVAPMFESAPINCLFDEAWGEYMPDARFWGTF